MALQNWKDVFLFTLRESPNVSRAARAAGVDRSYAYDCKREDAVFASAWDDAIQAAVDDVEESAFVRARSESDTLAIFLLKSHRRDVYGDQQPPQAATSIGPSVAEHARVIREQRALRQIAHEHECKPISPS